MAKDTRAQFLDTAEALFADRGFYGVSIAAVADELGLTKQALLHHFGSKEKLYGEVLAQISRRFEAIDHGAHKLTDPVGRLTAFFSALHDDAQKQQTRLLMRELLDNKQRADNVGAWYLKPFLENLMAMVKAVPNWQDASDGEALAALYQWLGAVNYFAVSTPTLSGIFGEKALAEMRAAFPATLRTMIQAHLAAR